MSFFLNPAPPPLSDNDSGDDWDEVNDEGDNISCLFCDDNLASFNTAVKHLETAHKFSLAVFKRKHSLDTYSYIKLINYVRANKTKPEELAKISSKAWDGDEYLTPVIQDDGWLMLGEFLDSKILVFYS